MVSYQGPFESFYVQCDFCGRNNVPRTLSNANEPNICSDCLERIKWQREKGRGYRIRKTSPPIHPPVQPYIDNSQPTWPTPWPDIETRIQDDVTPKSILKISSIRGLVKCKCGKLFEGYLLEKNSSKLVSICPSCHREHEFENNPNKDTTKTKKPQKFNIFQFISTALK